MKRDITVILLCFVAAASGANVAPVLSSVGKILFPGNTPNAAISAPSGALTLESGGTNQPVVLTPSGTGQVGIGTASPGVFTAAGRRYLTIKGSTLNGVLELVTAQADTAGAFVGQIQATDANNLDADPRAALIQFLQDGATASHRGGAIRFATKADSGGVTNWWALDKAGFGGFGGNLTPAYSVDATGDVNASVNIRRAGTIVVDSSTNVIAGGGAITVYRCVTGGLLPAGAMTTAAASCGTSADTGFRAK